MGTGFSNILSSLIILGFFSLSPNAEGITQGKPWLRVKTAMTNMKANSKGVLLAFTDENGQNLQFLDQRTRQVTKVTDAFVEGSFFWSPDGYRIFFRELERNEDKITSHLKAYDIKSKSSALIESYPHKTGFLTFDPRDYRLKLLYSGGIHTKRINLPDNRFAKWQLAQVPSNGRWVGAQNGILWVYRNGYSIKKMDDDGTPVTSFDISPDGLSIAWATKGGTVYKSYNGKNSVFVGYGKDPSWHPRKKFLVYAGARRVGNKTISYDLKMVDNTNQQKWLTKSQFSNERWPVWKKDGSGVLYTKDKSTDLFLMNL